jgi:hypothetical protein
MSKKINRTTAKQYIYESKGQIFSVTFRKKNGEIRDMNCRRGVSKYVTGEGLKFNPASRNLVNVFDMQKRAYRFININTLMQVRCNGNVYKVQDNV